MTLHILDIVEDRKVVHSLGVEVAEAQLASTVRFAPGQGGGVLPQAGGPFLAFDANNRPVRSLGTGADAGLRTDLAASNGSTLVAFASRDVSSRLGDDAYADDLPGAESARITNSLAERSSDTIRGSVKIAPRVRELIESANLPKFGHLVGDGVGSILAGPTSAPVLINATSDALIFSFLSDVTLRFGTYALDVNVTAEIASLKFVDTAAELWTQGGFRFNNGLTSSKFERVYINGISGAAAGIEATAGQNNNNLIADSDILNCSGPAIKLGGASTRNEARNNRIEGNGKAGVAQHFLVNPYGYHIHGEYSEASHEFAIAASGATDDAICMEGRVDIGSYYTGSGGFTGAKFSIGESRLVLGWNLNLQPTRAPSRVFIYAPNKNLLTDQSTVYTRDTGCSLQVTGKRRLSFANVAAQTFDFLSVARAPAAPGNGNMQALAGTVRVQFLGYDNAGTFRDVFYIFAVRLVATGASGGTVSVMGSCDLIKSIGNAGAITLTAQARATSLSTTTGALQFVFANAAVGDAGNPSTVMIDYDLLNTSTSEADRFVVTIPGA